MDLDKDYGKVYTGNLDVQLNMGIGLPNTPISEGRAEKVVNARVFGDHRDGMIPDNSRYPRRLNIFPLNN